MRDQNLYRKRNNGIEANDNNYLFMLVFVEAEIHRNRKPITPNRSQTTPSLYMYCQMHAKNVTSKIKTI